LKITGERPDYISIKRKGAREMKSQFSMEKAQKDLESTRQKIQAETQHISHLETCWNPVEESLSRADATVTAAAARYRRNAPVYLLAREGGTPPRFTDGETFDMLAFFFPEQVKARLHDALAELYEQDPETVPAATRHSDIRKAQARKLKLERTEESIITAAEAEGSTMPRRSDADPRAVLDLDDDPKIMWDWDSAKLQDLESEASGARAIATARRDLMAEASQELKRLNLSRSEYRKDVPESLSREIEAAEGKLNRAMAAYRKASDMAEAAGALPGALRNFVEARRMNRPPTYSRDELRRSGAIGTSITQRP